MRDEATPLSGLRVHSGPTSAPLPVSLLEKVTSPAAIWTSSVQSTTATTTAPPANSTHNNTSGLPVTTSSPTSPLPRNNSTETREEAITSPTPNQEGTNSEPLPPGFLSTAGEVHPTPTAVEHSTGSPRTSVPAAASQPLTPVPPQAPASSFSSLSTPPTEASSASITTESSYPVPSTQPTAAPATPEAPTEEPNSGHTPISHITLEPAPKDKTPPETQPGIVICGPETTTPFLIMQQVEHALSSGSIAAITVTVIAVVLLVFGVAAYLKIRHSSYGRLLDDHDYGSWGNYNNPLYDDS
ncbi:prostate androgen-regulated mucin-like protein 1 [Ctenodactylus gundi]